MLFIFRLFKTLLSSWNLKQNYIFIKQFSNYIIKYFHMFNLFLVQTFLFMLIGSNCINLLMIKSHIGM